MSWPIEMAAKVVVQPRGRPETALRHFPYRRSAPRLYPVLTVKRWVEATSIALGEALFRSVDCHGKCAPTGCAVGAVKRAAQELGMDPTAMGAQSLPPGPLRRWPRTAFRCPTFRCSRVTRPPRSPHL
jgi:hypothetical protein